MTSLYVRLAGPLQSWAGGRVTGNFVDTGKTPTPSALRGMIAAAFGWKRGEWEPWVDDVELTVRVDKPGAVVDDFQTIGPRATDFSQRLHVAMTGKSEGKKAFTPDARGLTSIVRRTYLADAEFLVEFSHDEKINEIAEAMAHPAFMPYLGKKAFAPSFPFILGTGEAGMLKTLPTHCGGDPTVGGVVVDVKNSVFDEWLSGIRGLLD